MTTQPALVARVVSVLGDLALPGETISMSPLHGGGQRGELRFEPETGPHVIRADAWGETTVVLSFTVDAGTAVRLARAYGHDLAAINAELVAALEASTNELEDAIDVHIYDVGEEPDDAPERRAVAANRALIERAKAGDASPRAPGITEADTGTAALAEGGKIDERSKALGEWFWYVVVETRDDGSRDPRAVFRDGEWRVYFETALELLAG